MAKKVISMTLDVDSIGRAIKELENYKKSLEDKTKEFVKRLADVGITASKNAMSGSKYEGYIRFQKTNVDVNGNNVSIEMYGENISMFHSEWDVGNSAEVNPILMAEFGSGWLARNDEETSKAGAGQGTFPNQKHAFDPKGWNYSVNGVLYHSYGETPSAPLQHAFNDMYQQISAIAREVFGGD